MRFRALVAVVALVGGAVAVAPPAAARPSHDTNSKPCVSTVEFRGTPLTNRSQVERRWEVAGMGIEIHNVPVFVHKNDDLPSLRTVVAYKRCGYELNRAWYGVWYGQSGRARGKVWAKGEPLDYTYE